MIQCSALSDYTHIYLIPSSLYSHCANRKTNVKPLKYDVLRSWIWICALCHFSFSASRSLIRCSAAHISYLVLKLTAPQPLIDPVRNTSATLHSISAVSKTQETVAIKRGKMSLKAENKLNLSNQIASGLAG